MTGYLVRLQEAIASSVDGMTVEQLRRRPEGKWSAGEVLEHLYLTYTGTIKGCERCLESGVAQPGALSLKNRLEQAVVITLGHMPHGRQAPERTRPTGMPSQEVVAGIGGRISDMDAILERCEQRFGLNTRFLNHPVLGPLTGRGWRRFHSVHGLHHVEQIRNLRATLL